MRGIYRKKNWKESAIQGLNIGPYISDENSIWSLKYMLLQICH